MSDYFKDNGPFRVVLKSASMRPRGRSVILTKKVLPWRDALVDALADLACIKRECSCRSTPRTVPCLRGEPGNDPGYSDYVENQRGFIALPARIKQFSES